MEPIKAQLAQLSQRERAELAHFLICSLEPEGDADAEAAWDAELARRLEDIHSGKVVGTPAADVFSQLRERFS